MSSAASSSLGAPLLQYSRTLDDEIKKMSVQQQDVSVAPREEGNPTPPPPTELNATRVLIIDDSKMNRYVAARLLKVLKLCHNPVESASGEDGLRIISTLLNITSDAYGDTMAGGEEENQHYDYYKQPQDRNRIEEGQSKICQFYAVMIDYEMAGMDGPTTAQRLREIGYTGTILGMLGSKNASDENTQRFLAHGANVVMKKPLDVEPFSRHLREAIAAYNGVECAAPDPSTARKLKRIHASSAATETKDSEAREEVNDQQQYQRKKSGSPVHRHNHNNNERGVFVEDDDAALNASHTSGTTSKSNTAAAADSTRHLEELFAAFRFETGPNTSSGVMVTRHPEGTVRGQGQSVSGASEQAQPPHSHHHNDHNNHHHHRRQDEKEGKVREDERGQQLQQQQQQQQHSQASHSLEIPVRTTGPLRTAVNYMFKVLFGRQSSRVAPR